MTTTATHRPTRYRINALCKKLAAEKGVRISVIKTELADHLGISYRYLNRIAASKRERLNHRQMKIIKQFFNLKKYEEIESAP